MRPETRSQLTDGGAELTCSIVPWDSESFGFVVAQIEDMHLGAAGSGASVAERFAEWCSLHDVRLVSSRLDHHQLRESMELERLGFRFVEMVYQPRLQLDRYTSRPEQGWTIVPATRDDVDALAELAGQVFTTGRFLLDFRLDPDLSGGRYATWVRRGFEAPGHSLLKVVVEGETAAFFLAETLDDHIYWHLTALAPRWQGRGLGAAAWTSMLAHHRASGARAVETTISGHNLAAMNTYARLGFTFKAAQMTFHWLRDAKPQLHASRPRQKPR